MLVTLFGDVDTEEINNAIAAIHNVGGGKVTFPAGRFDAAGVVQDSNVELVGVSGQTVLRHSDPGSWTPMVSSRISQTAGWINAGSNELHITGNVAGIDVGDLIAVTAAGCASPTQTPSCGAGDAGMDQTTTLAAPLLQGSVSMTVANTAKDFSTQTNALREYLLVGSEVVRGTFNANLKTFTNLTRAQLGTASPVQHPIGTAVSQAHHLVASVASISGTTVTLDRSARFSVSNGAPVYVGSSNVKVGSLTLDGNRAGAQTDSWPLYYQLASHATVSDCVVTNGQNGGVRLDATHESLIENCTFDDNRDPNGPTHPAHLWLFRGSELNTVRNNTFVGPLRWAIVIDDRTTQSSAYDAPSNSNSITSNGVTLDGSDVSLERYGVVVTGSDSNTISNNTIGQAPYGGGSFGIVVGQESPGQGMSQLLANANTISGNSISNVRYGIRSYGTGNTFQNNTVSAVGNPACDQLEGDDTWTGNVTNCPDG